MAAGRPAFRGTTVEDLWNAVLNQVPVPVRQLNPSIPPALEQVIYKAMDKNRELRYQSAAELRADLIRVKQPSVTPKVSGPEVEIIRQETRYLEAAAPREATVGRSIEVLAMVRDDESTGGLRQFLQTEEAPHVTPEDVRERPFDVEFPLDEKAKPQPLDITLRLESPGFDPQTQTKKLKVPAHGDSQACTFFIIPRMAGELVVNLELLNIHDQVLASRWIRTHALPAGTETAPEKIVVTIPLTLVVSRNGDHILGVVPAPAPEASPSGMSAQTGGIFRTAFPPSTSQTVKADSQDFTGPSGADQGTDMPTEPPKKDKNPDRGGGEISSTGGTRTWVRELDVASDPTVLTLVVVEGSERRSLVLDHFPFTVGRQTNCDLVLADPRVSRYHAVLRRESDGIYLEDHNSRQGTFVNGERTSRRKLMQNDRLQFGVEGGSFVLFNPDRSVSGIAQQFTTYFSEWEPKTGGTADSEVTSVFVESARELNSRNVLEEVLQTLLEASLRLTKAERGFVFLREAPNDLRMATGRNKDGEVIRDDSTISKSVLRDAAESTSEFIVTDTSESEKLSGHESVVTKNLKSVICIPLWRTNIQGTAADKLKPEESELLGVLYLDSHFLSGRLSQVSQDTLRTIAKGATALVQNAALVQAEHRASVSANLEAGAFEPPITAGKGTAVPVVPKTVTRKWKTVFVVVSVLLGLLILLALLLAFGGIISVRSLSKMTVAPEPTARVQTPVGRPFSLADAVWRNAVSSRRDVTYVLSRSQSTGVFDGL